MDTEQMTDLINVALHDYDDTYDDVKIKRLWSFRETGILTRDAGLVVVMDDGSEFQVTIVQSKAAKERTP